MEPVTQSLGGKHSTSMWEGRGLVSALLDAICSMAGCVATEDLSQVQEATEVVFRSCGRLFPCLHIAKTRIAQIQTGQKAAEVKWPRLAGCQA